MRRLYKDKQNKILGGVCAGLAEYLEIDVSIIRILFFLFMLQGYGLLMYFIMYLIAPEKPVT